MPLNPKDLSSLATKGAQELLAKEATLQDPPLLKTLQQIALEMREYREQWYLRELEKLQTELQIVRLQHATYTTPQIDIGAGTSIFAAGDAVGAQFEVKVPKAGFLVWARLWDPADQNIELDVVIARAPFTTLIADNAAFDLSDKDGLLVIHQLNFAVDFDYISNRMYVLDHIDMPYEQPDGKWYLQAVTKGAPTYAAGSSPRVQLGFAPNDPESRGSQT